MEDDDLNKRIGFCTGYLENTPTNFDNMLDNIIPDLYSELPKKWKSIILQNNYRINEIILPKDVKDTKLLRILAIRKGKLFRTAEIDNEIIEKQYSITV
jgi:hypothetical protein